MGKIILIDMDDVLADFEGRFLIHWKEKYPGRPYVSVEQRTVFNMTKQYPQEYSEDIRSIWKEKGFFRNLPIKEGALEAVKEISSSNDAFICTSPLEQYENCVAEKYGWVEENLGLEWTKKIVLTKDKTLIHGDYLIDDRPDITGVKIPSWEHLLYDMPYNRQIANKRRLTWQNWKEILLL